MEFSKKLLIFSWSVTFVITTLHILFAITHSYNEALMMAFNIITPLSWAESGTATGYYYWKAKNENRAKYAQRFLKDIANEWGAETAVRLAEIVLKD